MTDGFHLTGDGGYGGHLALRVSLLAPSLELGAQAVQAAHAAVQSGQQSADLGFIKSSVPSDHHSSLGPVRLPRTAKSPDRKSTRLNSSHITISYAVFCLKKKKKTVK